MKRIVLFAISIAFGGPAAAEGFVQVKQRDAFVSLMQGRELTRFGIKLTVTPDGQIDGRAFGREVRGAWQWRSGYFCRDLYWGQMQLDPNCQAVKVKDRTVRFISDQGAGEHADLRLR
ncbi:dihydrodipicolinate reductase [Roseovarius salis]|uniref:dihydrodipicolinate reductase n=1 Tax=Roseovarius salis TaxID=3376063 RepID=UPI0037CC30BD